MAKDEIEKVTGVAVTARPDFIPVGDTSGTDHITKEDMQVPRIALAQSLTPQVIEGKDGFRVGEMFNNLTEELLGKGPFKIAIFRADPPRWIEFIPRDQGGGVKDMNVPAHDSRTQFTMDPVKGKQKPLADKFYDFIVGLYPIDPADAYGRIIGLSFKGTGLRIAKQLNALVKFRNAPIYSGLYDLSSIMTKNAQGTFAIFQVKNAGYVPDKATFELHKAIHEQLLDKDITIAREGADIEHQDEEENARPGQEPQESNLGGVNM